ncbi:MAG: hypothetical protein ACXVAX_03640 [Pseudobdellovibrio sp.]
MFKIFKTISIGGLTKEQLFSRLGRAGIQFNKYAETLFQHPSFIMNESAEEFDLVKIKLTDLQMQEPYFFKDFVAQARTFNLHLGPLALAAFLRLEYLDQPEGPYLTIASEKPENNEDFQNGFYLRNIDGSLWLRGYRASDDYTWPSDSEFIFIRKKISLSE